MIEINTLTAEGFTGQFYKLHFNRIGFLLFPSPDLTVLTHFSKTHQLTQGKLSIHFNLTSLVKYSHFFKDIHYVLLTDYQEILYLPFLCRIVPQVCIIATSLTFQLARISIQAFRETLANFDATLQSVDFFQQSRIISRYEEEMDANFQDWTRLYSQQEIQNTFSKIVKVNYHQLYNTERGIILRSFPSGKNNGACFWELKSVLSNQKVLLINSLSQYSWRTCQSYNLERLKQSAQQHPYQLLIFTKYALNSFLDKEENRIADTIRRINSNANLGISTTIILGDDTLCIDLIPRLAMLPQGKIQSVILSNQSLHNFHNFINSYADYLSQYYRDQLFCENPDYPLIHYSRIKEKGFLSFGSLEEQAVNRKLPLREIVFQSHPFVRFVKNYEHFLEIQEQNQISAHVKHSIQNLSLASNFNSQLLNQLLSAIGQTKAYGFGSKNTNIQNLEIGRKYNLTGEKKAPMYITANNLSNSLLQSFTLKNNELLLTNTKIQLFKISKNWIDFMSYGLSDINKIKIVQKTKKSLRTQHSIIFLSQQWQICINSKSAQQLQSISNSLLPLLKKWEASNF